MGPGGGEWGQGHFLFPTRSASPPPAGRGWRARLRAARPLQTSCLGRRGLNSHIMFCKHRGSTGCLHRTYITKDIPNTGGGQQEGFPAPAARAPQRGGPAALGASRCLWVGCGLRAPSPSPVPAPGHLLQSQAMVGRPTGFGARLWAWRVRAPLALGSVEPQAGSAVPGRETRGRDLGTCGLRVVRFGHAGALATGEGVQGLRLPGQSAAAESAGAARRGHSAGGAQRQGAHRAAAAAGGPGGLRAGGGQGRAERQPLCGAGRAVPRLGSADGCAELDGQQEEERPDAGGGERGHRRAGWWAGAGAGCWLRAGRRRTSTVVAALWELSACRAPGAPYEGHGPGRLPPGVNDWQSGALEACVQNKFVLLLCSRPGAKRGRTGGLCPGLGLRVSCCGSFPPGPEGRSDQEPPARWRRAMLFRSRGPAPCAQEMPPPSALAPVSNGGMRPRERRGPRQLLAWPFRRPSPEALSFGRKLSPALTLSLPALPGGREDGWTVRPSQGKAPSVSLRPSVGLW